MNEPGAMVRHGEIRGFLWICFFCVVCCLADEVSLPKIEG